MRRRLALFALPLLLAGVPPTAAQAGRAQLVRNPGDEREDPSESFEYVAASGEANHVTIEQLDDGSVLVVDSVTVTLGRGCTRPSPGDTKRARCRSADADILEVSARLGDRDDTAVGQVLSGGPGNDRLTGTDVSGGSGNDVLRGEGTIKGGPGNDDMTGSASKLDFDIFDEGDADNGSDTIRGGGGPHDLVSYQGRRRAVRADLDGKRDDGARGERDLIASDVADLEGGSAADRLVGDSRSNFLTGNGGSDRLTGGGGDDRLWASDITNDSKQRSHDRLDGGAGDDELDGSAGSNRLKPGPGQDTVSGFGGNDRIGARDGSVDSVICGQGRDRVSVDGLDFASLTCERPRRRGQAAAVPLRVFVGTSDDLGPTVEIGCSIDGPPRCSGTAAISYKGRVRARARFRRIRRGRIGFTNFRQGRSLQGKLVRLTVRSRDRRGRVRRIVRRALVDTEG